MKTTLYAAGALALLLGTVAFAQNQGDPGNGPMGMDGQGMGMGDGMGMGPAGGMFGAMLGADFATLDADGDGGITEADLVARAAARFAEADADGSGGLTGAEMVAMAEIIRQEQMAARLAQRMARIDDSADGEIQFEELQARAPAGVHFFDAFDADNDGAVSAEEFAVAEEEMAAMREDRGPREDGWGWWGRGDHDGRGQRQGN
jgi:Ca2+-binding EF-hand superfamily protein